MFIFFYFKYQSDIFLQALAGQFSQQVQVIQGGLPGGSYLQHLYQNAQGQLIMPLQSAAGMNTQIQPNTINTLNQPIQVKIFSYLDACHSCWCAVYLRHLSHFILPIMTFI